MLLEGIGEAGQRRLRASTALLVGCGALGSAIAELLVRAGVGRLRLVDRDLVELTNLQRQVLFTESDAQQGLPKAAAAADRLGRVNSTVAVEPVVADFAPDNAQRLADDADLLIDGTDNYETRFLLNDLSVKRGLPYVYGGAVGTRGMVYNVLPGEGPCLRCIFGDAPAGGGETCDTVGVLGPLASAVASLQAVEAVKLLTGNRDRLRRTLLTLDPWAGGFRELDVSAAHDPADCPCCGLNRFDYLDGARGSATTSLCGRNAVQIRSGTGGGAGDGGDRVKRVDLDALARRLARHGQVQRNEFLLRAEIAGGHDPFHITIFPDGRAIIHGTADPATARNLYAKYVGM